MRVQHNIPAMNAYRNYNNNSSGINKNLEKLSSGYKINRAGDDAAGLAISEKMRAQITGLEVAQKNAKDGISLVQTAEGALTEVQDMLNRMYRLAEQSANGTYSNDVDRDQLDKEVEKLRDEIDRIATTANFNGTKLLNGDLAGTNPVNGAVADDDTSGVTVSNVNIKDEELIGKELTGQGTQLGNSDTAPIGLVFNKEAISGYTLEMTSSDQVMDGGSAYAVLSGTSADVVIRNNETGEAVGKFTLTTPDAITTSTSFKMEFSAPTADVNGASSDTPLTYNEGDKVETAMNLAKETTTWSGEKGLYLWIGAEVDKENALKVEIESVKSDDLKIGESNVDITTQAGALNSLVYIEDAINKVSDIRGTLGATQNRLEHTINNLSVMQENMQDAESTIRDTDVAEEMMKYTKNSILVQSAQAMLAQANQLPQGVLQLLQ